VQTPERPTVAVTGIGVVGPTGNGHEALWSSLMEHRSGVVRLEGEQYEGLPARHAAPIADFDLSPYIDKRAARRMGRFAQFALVASRLALADAGLADVSGPRTAITIHTGAGGIPEGDEEVLRRRDDPGRMGPLYVPLVSGNMAAANAAIQLGVTGPVTAGVGACAAGTIAVAEGFHTLQRGDADVVLAGASDAALTPYLMSSLANAGALSTAEGEPATLSRPFDRGRTGFIPAEGAAMLVLERLDAARARGARVHAILAGVAVSCDAFHVTAPDPEGAGAELAIRGALARAGLEPDGVGAVVAHGTGTQLNDASEAGAVARVVGAGAGGPPVTAPKAVLGHGLGAAGAFSAAIGALIARHGLVPPIMNLDDPDPACDLNLVRGAPAAFAGGAVMVNAFGFGGQNAVLVLRPDDGAA
jgi:3-oxoacyl-[acyl-carrier-protein] synthase II